MTTRVVSILLLVASALANSLVADASPARFIDPSRMLAIDLPAGRWVAKAGFGEIVAALDDGRGARIKILSNNGRPEKTMADIVAREFHGVKLGRDDKITSDGRVLPLVAFESGTEPGIVIDASMDGMKIYVLCRAPAGRFVTLFLECRQLSVNIRPLAVERDEAAGASEVFGREMLPSPGLLDELRSRLSKNPKSFAAAADLVAARSIFANLDGRGGCPGVPDEPRRFAAISAKHGDGGMKGRFDALSRLLAGQIDLDRHVEGRGDLGKFAESMRLVREGRRKTAEGMLEKLSRSRDGFFARLELARMELSDGNSKAALKRLSRLERGSALADALRIWAARLEGKSISIADEDHEFCGSSGAMAAYQIGLAREKSDAGGAERYFQKAIDSDPSYSPPYISLGRLYLKEGAGEATARLASLLSRAPDTSEISRLRAQIESMGGSRKGSR